MNENPNIICALCGENDFNLKEGYYYCNECGTKADQVHAFEVEIDEDFEGGIKHRNKLKIKTDKSSQRLELTSWECYNYILRGMVEELIDMGAKDELKPMVFQIWAAFLRNKEVAFFSRHHPELPKLGVRFEHRDANILYNHAVERKKARREKKENASIASGSRREWKKQIKKFTQSQYEASIISQSQSMCSQSFISQSSLGDTSFNSSGSAPSNRAIKLKFSSTARKQLKKKMSLAHLKKHEQDFNSSLKCHKIRTNARDLNYTDRSRELNLKLVYSILAVALNLIEDEIQLTDLLRFISEGHVSTINLERFFPSNISEHCRDTLKTYRLHYKFTEFSATHLRSHCSRLCKAIHIKHLKTPDLIKLVRRYTTELCLPEELITFIERLINLHPPNMTWVDRSPSSPCYESRAMAYIIFSLKLLFGIDGRKEKQISRSASRVNAELATMNLSNHDELFVWDTWVEYIELRKVVLCKRNLAICKQFKQTPSRELYLQSLEERSKHVVNDLSKDMVKRQSNMSSVFQKFINVSQKENKEAEIINFTPSLTPCLNYLKRLKQDPTSNSTIPELLNVDHSKRSLYPFLNPKKLKETFSNCDRKLKVVRVACTSKQQFVGMFKNPFIRPGSNNPVKVNLTDDKQPWDTKVKADKPAESIFQPYLEAYNKKSLANMRSKYKKAAANIENFDIKDELPAEYDIDLNKSFDLFEDDMQPVNFPFTAPRRNLERVNLFDALSEDEEFEEIELSQDESFVNVPQTTTAVLKFKISNLDCWLLLGKASELNEVQKNELKRSLQMTFFWLLETCALTIGVDWRELYDELMVLETFFAHAIEPLENLKDRIVFQKDNHNKDINKLVRHFQYSW